VENEPKLIRDQMQETRTSLTEKIEALESQVSSTVQSATAAVTETVESVKSSVSNTVDSVKEGVESTVSTVKESVKDAFDLPGHVDRHPWLAMAGSVAVGFAAGKVLNGLVGGRGEGRETPRAYSAFSEALPPKQREAVSNGHGRGSQEKEPSSEGGLLSGLANAFGAELGTLKGLGLSAVAGIVRDLVTQSVPGEIGGRLREWMDDMTKKMGAKPLSEPLISTEESAPESDFAKEGRSGRQSTSVRRETMPRR